MSRRADRQRKQQRDDADSSGLSTAGKVALGVAAAAAGAAIGYLGNQLLQAWLSEPAEEEKTKKCDEPKKCDDSDSDDCKSKDGSKPPSRDDAVDSRDDHYKPGLAASQVNSSMQTAARQMSLHDQLFQYYREYVDIPGDRMQAVQTAVDQVTAAVRSQLRQSNHIKRVGLKIGDLVTFGSMTEGHQVIRPTSVDVMVPVMFGSECRARESHRKFPGSFVIVVPSDDNAGELCDDELRLVTRKLLEVLQVGVEKAAETVSGSEYQCAVLQPLMSDNATAISLAVYAAGYDQVAVNLVPFVISDGRLFLPLHLTEQRDICLLYTSDAADE